MSPFLDRAPIFSEEEITTLFLHVSTERMDKISQIFTILIGRLPRMLARDNRQIAVVSGANEHDLTAAYEKSSHAVMRQWTTQLPLRHQGVLLTAIRGCDGAPKEDPSKSLSRMIRRAVMNPADERETSCAGGFFGFDPAKLDADMRSLLHSLDQYPLHYIMHLMHASQIIGYKHPNDEFRDFFRLTYALIVRAFHLRIEPEADMDYRLTMDRVKAGTTERDL